MIYAYERAGTANVFLFTEPLTGWRTVDVHEHRTVIAWAHQIKHLLDDCYPDADKVHVVCDNLNTQLMIAKGQTDSAGLRCGLERIRLIVSSKEIPIVSQYHFIDSKRGWFSVLTSSRAFSRVKRPSRT
jgi:hypothetical protein